MDSETQRNTQRNKPVAEVAVPRPTNPMENISKFIIGGAVDNLSEEVYTMDLKQAAKKLKDQLEEVAYQTIQEIAESFHYCDEIMKEVDKLEIKLIYPELGRHMYKRVQVRQFQMMELKDVVRRSYSCGREIAQVILDRARMERGMMGMSLDGPLMSLARRPNAELLIAINEMLTEVRALARCLRDRYREVEHRFEIWFKPLEDYGFGI